MGRTRTTSNLLKGTRGNDWLEVSQRTDQPWTIDAGAGNDVLIGGSGADTMLGGGGNDIIFGMPNDVRLSGGTGYDTLDVSGATAPIRYIATSGGQLTYWPDSTPSTYAVAEGFERVIGGSGADYLVSGATAQTLVGGGGGDHIEGGAGNDVLVGDYLSLASYNPLGLSELPDDGGADYFEFSHNTGGDDQILDFEFGVDHLFFYGVEQPDQSAIYVRGNDLVVVWENGTVTLTGLGGLPKSSYADLFTLTSGDLSVMSQGYKAENTTALTGAPAIANLSGDSVTYTEGATPVRLDFGSDAVVSDGDSSNFDGGSLTVNVGLADGNDLLSIASTGSGVGEIGASDGVVTYQGVVIGTYDGGYGAEYSTTGGGIDVVRWPLVIQFNANATPEAVQALVRAITFSNDDLVNPSTEVRGIGFTLADGDGNSTQASSTVTFNSVNDAPSGADNRISVSENDAYTFTTADFGFSDLDGDSFAGVVITTLPTNGVLYLDGLVVASSTFVAAADIANGLLRFQPDAEEFGDTYSTFTFQVRDDGGTNNGGQDTDQTPNTITVDVVDDGTAGDDILVGSSGDDHIEGFAGNDTVYGAAGNDTIDAGDGDDTLEGGDGDDSLHGGAGTDTASYASAGGVSVSLAVTTAQNTGGAGIDTLTNIENITGSAYDDTLTGDSGSNTLIGGHGSDQLIGGAGNDLYIIDNWEYDQFTDTIWEDAGGGTDTVHVDLDVYYLPNFVENVVSFGGTGQGTWIEGNGLNNVIIGDETPDLLLGAGGNDVLDGGAGQDQLFGGDGNDAFIVDHIADFVSDDASFFANPGDGAAGSGTDEVRTSISYSLAGAEQADIENLTATSTMGLTLTGNGLVNVITGNVGNDIIDGGAGADTMLGGGGSDLYHVNAAGDAVTESADQGTDHVNASITYTLGANVENLTLTGANAISGTGNTLANTLTGNSANNRLNGGGGADSMRGGAGNDTYYVDNAGDVISELSAQGTDLVRSSISYTLGANVENLTLTGTAGISAIGNTLANTLTGNRGANTLNGGGGNDTLNGGTGADTLVGGTGNDTYVVDNASDVVTELSRQGADLVQTRVSYTLGNNVENLTLTGTGAISGTGNTLANTITGNGAANVLRGQAGADVIVGGSGSDDIYGGTGKDQLSGGSGSDDFFFDTALNASTNVDKITDFSSAADSIKLSLSVFKGITAAGTLAADAFRLGTAAADADDRIIYDSATGKIYYDADGSGAGAKVLFAQVTAGTSLTRADFIAIAATTSRTANGEKDSSTQLLASDDFLFEAASVLLEAEFVEPAHILHQEQWSQIQEMLGRLDWSSVDYFSS